MNSDWFQLIVFVFSLNFILITAEKAIWCIPHGDYFNQCNRCWCMNNAIFICSHAQCNAVPNQFWKAMKPKPTKQGARAVEQFFTNRQRSDGFVQTYMLPMVTDYVKKIIHNWGELQIKAFFKYLRQAVDKMGNFWLQKLGRNTD
ncbi:hypothetical protein ILUMI_11570 [Ignelater luminosus]|uniref:Uncharacterized protein n=1 Tax=Ignelater luminosus TaxID=2038154 RepID=A0A8K0CY65_IGNLU|nr:hypothetical protein ILUMI_11570 [Ignelater luminosus]